MQGSTRIDELRQKFHENPRRYFAPLANEYRKAGDPEQAIAICRAHLAQQPAHMSGHVVYGQALYDAKRPEEARAVFEKALTLDPDNAIVLKQLGDIAREKGDSAEARHWYARALDVDPNDRETAAYFAELAEPVSGGETAEAPASEAAPAEASVAQPPVEQEVPPGEPTREPEVVAGPEPGTLPEPEPRAEPEPVVASEPETLPSPEPETLPSPEPETAAPAPIEEDVTWRKTPPHEESPFVTRTMAELYAKQGYREAALDVYRQLALQHPNDKEISDRIGELEKGEKSEAKESPVPEAVPFEPMITDMPVEAEAESLADISTESVFAPSSEDLNLDFPPSEADRPARHFTETELSTGDTWDTDAWGAGFDSDEDLNLEFNSPDVPSPETPSAAEMPREAASVPEVVESSAAPAEPETSVEAEPIQTMDLEPSPVEESAREEPAADEPIAAAERIAEEPIAEEPIAEEPISEEPIVEEPIVEEPPHVESIEQESVQQRLIREELTREEPDAEEPVQPEQPREVNLAAPAAEDLAEEPAQESVSAVASQAVGDDSYDSYEYEYEPEPEDASHVVAYSPQLPQDEDLPHYAPKGPTVRDFFAALGAFRPSAKKGSSITANAGMPAPQPENEEPDHIQQDDSLASLFADSEVSDEDSRAAFALSGALGASEPTSAAITAPQEPQPPAEAPTPVATQESEEDIRRFREWLDGLADS